MGGDAQCHQPALLSWSGTEINKSMADQSHSAFPDPTAATFPLCYKAQWEAAVSNAEIWVIEKKDRITG
jgi:hypothetical protein